MSSNFMTESGRILRVDVNGGVWMKPGAAIAHRGELRFERLPTLDAASTEDAVMREVAPLVRVNGHGRLFCSDRAARVSVVDLDGHAMVVAAQSVLAFEETLAFRRTLFGHRLGVAAGGLIVTTFSGRGALAFVTAGATQQITERLLPGDEPPAAGNTDRDAMRARANRMAPGQECRARRRALRFGTVVGQTEALGREAIDAGGRHTPQGSAAVTTQLTEAEVVHMEEQHVRSSGQVISVTASPLPRATVLRR